MFSTTRLLITTTLVAASALAIACGQSTTSSLSPTGLGGFGEAAADGSTLKVTAPTLASPVGGVEITDLDPDMVFGPSSPVYLNGAAPSFEYELEVYDEENQRIYARTLGQGSGGTTTHELENDLNFNEVHTWRVRARLGEHTGPWSALASFKTFEDPISADSCAHVGNPLGIIQCQRSKYGSPMGHGELIQLLRATARDFNLIGVPGGPYGILQKNIGNNCAGYSCDILCAGQGNGQRQYDILRDEDEPQWGGPLPEIRADVCEIP